jgi:D-amino-acid dehydrogenase
MPRKIARWLLARHAPVVVRPRLDPYQWRWLLRFARNCSAERFARNKARMQRIAHYSKACLKELRAETGIIFDHGTGGVLQLFRTEEEVAGAEKSARVLAEFGVAHRIVDARDVLAIEPALRTAAVSFAGGLHLPEDETGDCHRFTVALADILRQHGSLSASIRRCSGCSATAAALSAPLPIGARSRPMPMSLRSAARRPPCCGRSGSISRSIQ